MAELVKIVRKGKKRPETVDRLRADRLIKSGAATEVPGGLQGQVETATTMPQKKRATARKRKETK